MFEIGFWILIALVVFGGIVRRAANDLTAVAAPSTDRAAADFAIYRDAVADQDSRLDALDSSLGALAALLFAILSYLPGHRAGDAHHSLEPHLGVFANILLIVAIMASLFAAIAFRGAVGPSLDVMLTRLEADREGTFRENTDSLARDYFRNSKLIRRKLLILRAGVIAGAVGTLVMSVAPVVQ